MVIQLVTILYIRLAGKALFKFHSAACALAFEGVYVPQKADSP